MFTSSIWNRTAEIGEYPTLSGDTSCDVAVIGGGVTGVSTALLLEEKGLDVVLLESLKVGGGTSSHSTGNLYATVDKNLGHLREKYDADAVRTVVTARGAALDRMEEWINRFEIDCDFERRPWYLYAASGENNGKIEEEYEHALEVGLPMERAGSDEFPLSITAGVKLPHQAQFNPMRYVQGLARNITSDACRIYECTRVTDVEESEEKVVLKTTGGTVTARFVVHATHIPKGIRLVQTKLSMYREYGIACRADRIDFPEGIFWGYHGEDGKKFSSRLYERNGERYVIVVGEPHRVGQIDDNRECIRNLEAFARDHYGLQDVAFRWGGQHYRPADLLPYIGRESGDGRTFIATGYSTDGLVYGTLAGMLIADQITGDENEWIDLFDADRFAPLKSAAGVIEQGVNTVAQYLKDLPGVDDDEEFGDLSPGEGAVVEKNGEKIAAYRNDRGELRLLSAVCTHMQCIVNWNNAEQTWDCPCHASRFRTDGTVLEGPAFDPLPRVDLSGKKRGGEE